MAGRVDTVAGGTMLRRMERRPVFFMQQLMRYRTTGLVITQVPWGLEVMDTPDTQRRKRDTRIEGKQWVHPDLGLSGNS